MSAKRGAFYFALTATAWLMLGRHLPLSLSLLGGSVCLACFLWTLLASAAV